MSISSSGFGDEVGRPTVLSPAEQEATAYVALTQAALGIVKDSLEISFTKFGGNLWKYDTSASHPTLAPLISSRMASDLKEIEDKSWEAFFDQLKKNLPVEVNDRLVREKEKAKELRNPSYVALEEVLVTTAKALSYITKAAKADSADSKTTINALSNLLISASSGKNVVEAGQAFVSEANAFLNSLGHNDPNYDRLYNNVKQMETEVNRMYGLVKGK